MVGVFLWVRYPCTVAKRKVGIATFGWRQREEPTAASARAKGARTQSWEGPALRGLQVYLVKKTPPPPVGPYSSI